MDAMGRVMARISDRCQAITVEIRDVDTVEAAAKLAGESMGLMLVSNWMLEELASINAQLRSELDRLVPPKD